MNEKVKKTIRSVLEELKIRCSSSDGFLSKYKPALAYVKEKKGEYLVDFSFKDNLGEHLEIEGHITNSFILVQPNGDFIDIRLPTDEGFAILTNFEHNFTTIDLSVLDEIVL